MSHHVGMSIISCANACFDNIFVERFMSDPRMNSAKNLIEEKIPVNAATFIHTNHHSGIKNKTGML